MFSLGRVEDDVSGCVHRSHFSSEALRPKDLMGFPPAFTFLERFTRRGQAVWDVFSFLKLETSGDYSPLLL